MKIKNNFAKKVSNTCISCIKCSNSIPLKYRLDFIKKQNIIDTFIRNKRPMHAKKIEILHRQLLEVDLLGKKHAIIRADLTLLAKAALSLLTGGSFLSQKKKDEIKKEGLLGTSFINCDEVMKKMQLTPADLKSIENLPTSNLFVRFFENSWRFVILSLSMSCAIYFVGLFLDFVILSLKDFIVLFEYLNFINYF